MQFSYYQPRGEIGPLVSSYYSVTFAETISDIMRAEIANVRFVVGGQIESNLGGIRRISRKGDTLLCGPTHQASSVTFEAGFHVFGAAITPLGWARMFDVSADELADLIVPLEDYVSEEHRPLIERVFAAPDDAARALRCDELFAAMIDLKKQINHVFLDQMTRWITSPEDFELADLKAALPMSTRQIERLSRRYFGASPRTVHRKFRALNSANRLTWQELDDWRDVAATRYSDQSHFIREFKHFNGRTPLEFIKGTHLLVRTTLQERRKIVHKSPFSLIG